MSDEYEGEEAGTGEPACPKCEDTGVYDANADKEEGSEEQWTLCEECDAATTIEDEEAESEDVAPEETADEEEQYELDLGL